MLCEYGCGHEANYTFKNGRYCCSEYVTQCPAFKELRDMSGKKNPMFGKKHSVETIKKIKRNVKIALSKPDTRVKLKLINKGKEPWNKGKSGVYSDESRSKMGPLKNHQSILLVNFVGLK